MAILEGMELHDLDALSKPGLVRAVELPGCYCPLRVRHHLCFEQRRPQGCRRAEERGPRDALPLGWISAVDFSP